MKSTLFCSLFYMLLICWLTSKQSGFCIAMNPAGTRLGGDKTDRDSLLAIKAQINLDPNSVLTSWNESIHFCQWQGVTCGHRHQRVTVLDLHSRQLKGSISPHVGNLSFLRELVLNNNSFAGEIPPQISHLQRLQILYLTNNSLVGEIPANLSSCSNLIWLHLSGNKLVGKIPSSIGSLSKLQRLGLYNNFLSVGDNMLSGTIPPSLFNISALTALDLMGNQFQGSLPSDMFSTLPNLEVIDLGLNQFITGSIPASISNASNLAQFIVAGNSLTGRVPSLQKLYSLWEFVITTNHLGSGKAGDLNFLSDLTNSTGLGLVDMSYNNFGGMLPASLGNLSTNLVALLVDSNMLHGSIPNGIGNLVNLGILMMRFNHFTGNIPADIGKLRKIGRLGLDSNKLSGRIPSSVGNLTELTTLELDGNYLEGSIPPSLGQCQKLLLLQLSQNNLSGSIPLQVWGLSSLSVGLDLSQNHLTGSLPMEVGNLKGLNALVLSDNMLSGELPSNLGKCESLGVLLLQTNSFQGTIPLSFQALRGIQVLDLSRNNLSGKIPQYLEGFRLLNLNLSFNDFEGMLPVGGAFKNTSAISIAGNRKLCGGVAEFHLPKCNFPFKEVKKKSMTLALKIVIFVVPALVIIVLVLSFLYLLRLRKKLRKDPASSNLEIVLQVSYAALVKATAGFSSANLVGVGSFGSVYKGVLNDGGAQLVAIKVFNLLRQGASKSFIAECEALRNIRHRNLVKIITACSSADFHGNDFKALVYEFMDNGSLEEWLHPPTGTEEVGDVSKSLSLLQRLNIAIDVACALDYLHNHCETPIVHCDLKPSNVLLDNEFTGHVSDFGLARFLSQPTSNDHANQSSSIGIRGSVGYAAPEYGMGSEVSKYGDVYSFGILLLEMFTGKRPTDNMLGDGLNLHSFVKMNHPKRVTEIADSVLFLQGGMQDIPDHRSASAQKMEECLSLIFRTGVECSAESPRDRKGISDAASALRSIRDMLLC